jgi:hypothetical protein
MEYRISGDLLGKIMNFLNQQPYAQVVGLFGELIPMINAQNKEKQNEDKAKISTELKQGSDGNESSGG